jgi:bile acid-coenzyme A ligase
VGISHAARIVELAAERPGDVVYRQILADGTEEPFTWPDLERRSRQVAVALQDRGLAHGDRLGLALPNSSQLLLGVLAGWRLGAVPIPIRWDLPEWELERLRQVVDAPITLGQDDIGWIDETAGSDVPDLPDATSPHVNGICSSGSTGMPKVILVNRPAEYDPGLIVPIVEQWMAVPRPERVLVMGPMYHTNGFATLYRLLEGDELVVLERFNAALAVDLVERLGITTFTATPTMLKRIADVPGIDERDLSSIQWILQGAAPMPPSLVHRWAGLIGAGRIVMAYGMTEGLGLTALRGDEWLTHQGSVGRGVRDTEIRILDPDGKELPAGEIGEIYLRSSISAGYRYLGGAPRLPATEEGFQSAGDLGYVDDDGFLYLVDRRVDVIITGGANVFPAEVETALIDHPKVADVVVIGLLDEEWGRRVHAVVEPADAGDPPTAEELIAFAKGRLAPYKVPKTVELVDAIPRSAATKVNRQALVEARGG